MKFSVTCCDVLLLLVALAALLPLLLPLLLLPPQPANATAAISAATDATVDPRTFA
jgi:hypothetical protein